jgi:hypothetical protein
VVDVTELFEYIDDDEVAEGEEVIEVIELFE